MKAAAASSQRVSPVRSFNPAAVAATTARDQFAVEQLASSGVGYFNPLIGANATETFGKISLAMEFLHQVITTADADQGQEGMALFVQSIWTAAQFEQAAAANAEQTAQVAR